MLDVKQKSESDADILLSFDQSSRKGGPNRCWLAGSNVLGPLDRCRNATSGLIAKPVPRTAFAADWAPTCWRGPVTCERGRNASLKCVSPPRSHMNRVPTPRRSLSSCHGIQLPGSGKKACKPGSSTACCANTGVTIAVDRIAAKLRSLKLVIAESLHVFGAVHTMRGPLMERLESAL